MDLIHSFFRVGSLGTSQRMLFVLAVFNSWLLYLFLHFLCLVVKQFLVGAHIFTFVQVCVPWLEVFVHVSRLVAVSCLGNQLGVLLFTRLLKRHVSLLLPFLVNVVPWIFFIVLDLSARFISFFLNDSGVPINLLQSVLLFYFIPFHYSLSFNVGCLVIWDKIQCHIFQKSSFMLVPERLLFSLLVIH